MSKIEVNTIEPQCGTNLTLGANNDTISLGTGAGFTGGIDAVKWETTPQTGNFQATAGRGYFMNTTSGGLQLTTPASPSAGDIFAVADYARTFGDNNLTIVPHASAKIGGVAQNATLDVSGQAATFVYIDSTQGWINVQNAENTETGIPPFIGATGGTITNSGDCRIHTFTGPGTFTVCRVATCAANNQISYMVVAGGGGSGAVTGGYGTGGGGAGGFREDKSPVTPYTASPLDGAGNITVTATSYPITVGAGGAGGPAPAPNLGSAGSTSTFSTITSAGGGQTQGNGGSGGGGGPGASSGVGSGGTGNTPPVTPSQGSNGGPGGHSSGGVGAGGGGGATAVGVTGVTGPSAAAGDGGAGATTGINGSNTAFAGGGGGGTNHCAPIPSGKRGVGGVGGGGNGQSNCAAGEDGTANTGGGAGGSDSPNGAGNSGGSGIVIIRYKVQ